MAGVIVRESGRLTQMLAELSDVADLSEPVDEDVGLRSDTDVANLVESCGRERGGATWQRPWT